MEPAEAKPGTGLTPQRRAMAVVDGLMHGLTPEDIAAKIAGGSLVRVLDMIADGMSPDRLAELIALNEIQSGIVLGTLKIEALRTLGSFISGTGFDDLRGKESITANDMRLVELRRRACISMVRLNPLPARRDSYGDSRMASAPGARQREIDSHDSDLRRWRDAADRFARLDFSETDGGGTFAAKDRPAGGGAEQPATARDAAGGGPEESAARENARASGCQSVESRDSAEVMAPAAAPTVAAATATPTLQRGPGPARAGLNGHVNDSEVVREAKVELCESAAALPGIAADADIPPTGDGMVGLNRAARRRLVRNRRKASGAFPAGPLNGRPP